MKKVRIKEEEKGKVYATGLILFNILATITQHHNMKIRVFVGGGSLVILLALIFLERMGKIQKQYKYLTSILFNVLAFFFMAFSLEAGYVNVIDVFLGVGLFALYNDYKVTTFNLFLGLITINFAFDGYRDTVFSTLPQSQMITINIYYILLCGCLIASNKMAKKFIDDAKEAELQATEKSQRVEELLAQIEESTKNLTEISSGVKVNIEGIDATSSYITESVAVFTERIMNENESVLSASESVENVYNNIENVMGISKDMIKYSNDTKVVVDDGVDKIKDLFGSMDNVKTVVISTRELMDELSKQMNNVHSIVETIGDISEQTNMLSLNAAIESARAGEHGRGFAVVSNHIRSLASESKEATNNISRIIVDLYKIINLVVEKVGHGEESVLEAENSKLAVEDMIDDMQNTIATTLDKTRLVQSKINELTSLSKSIKDNIHEISDSTNNNAALIQDIMAKIEEENASISYVTKDIKNLDELAEGLSLSLK